jgi:hypothetical protein
MVIPNSTPDYSESDTSSLVRAALFAVVRFGPALHVADYGRGPVKGYYQTVLTSYSAKMASQVMIA